ncbi:MAG TPA: aromatic ring-hydroxylating dioxygenase subunit alpha, partial [Gemmataceae bacterium]|nr:aromatic ring-hydroxylating dioxygenase subunit alpha [Gemmataceae bacterium]
MTKRLEELMQLFDPELPLERARTIPGSWYLDPEIYQAECRAIFAHTWQAIGRADQVAEPGMFFTADVAGEPIVVLRDPRGILRAFFNVCRHRAARVATEPAGRLKRLRCPYHGWTYDLEGRLRGTPEFDGVQEFNREENGLVPLAVASWGPLVWVNLGANPPSLIQHLAPFPERTQNLELEKFRFVERREYRPNCNWKVFIDNYLDGGYHVNSVHPELA